MGTPVTGFDRPIFLGFGLLDRDVPPSSTLTFYDELVADNQNVTLNIYPDEDHSGTVLASLVDSTPFLHRAFTGDPSNSEPDLRGLAPDRQRRGVIRQDHGRTSPVARGASEPVAPDRRRSPDGDR